MPPKRSALCRFRELFGATLAVLLCVFCQTVGAAAPPAGTVIQNKASVSYFNPALNRSETLDSNPVSVVVQPVESFTLEANQQIFRSPGAPFSFSHTLTNTGNTPFSVALSTTPTAGGSFTMSAITVYRDLNQNGIADSGDPVIAQGGVVGVAVGESISLVITGSVPVSAMQGQSAGTSLTAISTTQSVTRSVADQVLISSAALLQLEKQASATAPLPGQDLTYTIRAVNNGNGVATGTSPPGGQQLLVNGVPDQLVLLRDQIPAGSRYVSGSLTLQSGGIALYHKAGAPDYSYQTSEPADVDEVAYGVTALAVGQVASFSFTVRISTTAAGGIANTGRGLYRDGVNIQPVETVSNTVSLPLPAAPPVITFYNSDNFATPAQAAQLGSRLYIQAEAPACNANSTVIEERTIVVTSAMTGDEESFISRETGPNTGTFRVLDIPTKDASFNQVVKGDSIIEAMKHDVLTASISGCGSSSVSARLLIDPGGTVFDSRSNLPVPGASVTLIDVTGAGDSFCGGFMADFVQHGDPVRAAAMAAASGRMSSAPAAASSSFAWRFS